MSRRIRTLLVGFAIALAIGVGLAAPAVAANQGTYSGTLYATNTLLASGEHNSYYGKGTVSVDANRTAGGIFWFERPGGGRCSTMVTLQPRITGDVTYISQFTGGVQLVGTSNTSSSHYVSGFYRFNVN